MTNNTRLTKGISSNIPYHAGLFGVWQILVDVSIKNETTLDEIPAVYTVYT